jgi:hypothetical protein
MDMRRRIQTMRPLARGRSTSEQRTNRQALLAMAVMLGLVLIAQVDRAKHESLFAALAPLEQQNRRSFFSNPLEQWQASCDLASVLEPSDLSGKHSHTPPDPQHA